MPEEQAAQGCPEEGPGPHQVAEDLELGIIQGPPVQAQAQHGGLPVRLILGDGRGDAAHHPGPARVGAGHDAGAARVTDRQQQRRGGLLRHVQPAGQAGQLAGQHARQGPAAVAVGHPPDRRVANGPVAGGVRAARADGGEVCAVTAEQAIARRQGEGPRAQPALLREAAVGQPLVQGRLGAGGIRAVRAVPEVLAVLQDAVRAVARAQPGLGPGLRQVLAVARGGPAAAAAMAASEQAVCRACPAQAAAARLAASLPAHLQAL